MTKLHPTNLYAVEVPIDATQIIICPTHDGLINSIHWTVDNILFSKKIDFNLKILGEVTKDEISFDASEHVEKQIFEKHTEFYEYTFDCFDGISAEDSFRSLLESNGLEFKEDFKYVILKPI